MNKYLLLSLGIMACAPLGAADNQPGYTVPNEQHECAICMETGEGVTLSCGHIYCRDCLKEMINKAQRDNTIERRCPDLNCGKDLAPVDILNITQDREAVVAAGDQEGRAQLRAMPGFKQCPTPDCLSGFFKEGQQKETIKCEGCQQSYCSACLINHAPNAVCSSAHNVPADRESAELLRAETKPCPKCNVRVQKSSGCDRIQCEQCRYQFCWACGIDWDGQGGYGHRCTRRWAENADPINEQMINQLPGAQTRTAQQPRAAQPVPTVAGNQQRAPRYQVNGRRTTQAPQVRVGRNQPQPRGIQNDRNRGIAQQEDAQLREAIARSLQVEPVAVATILPDQGAHNNELVRQLQNKMTGGRRTQPTQKRAPQKQPVKKTQEDLELDAVLALSLQDQQPNVIQQQPEPAQTQEDLDLDAVLALSLQAQQPRTQQEDGDQLDEDFALALRLADQ